MVCAPNTSLQGTHYQRRRSPTRANGQWAASVVATFLDLLFLALLGVMWLDVVLFTTGAWGTLIRRLVVSIFASPFLWGYMSWHNSRSDGTIESRPVATVLQQFAVITEELPLAEKEIERRRVAEKKLNTAHSEAYFSHSLCPVCSELSSSRLQCVGHRVDSMTVRLITWPGVLPRVLLVPALAH